MLRKSKILSFLLCFSLLFQQAGFAQVAGELDISGHLSAFRNSLIQAKFRPLHLRSLGYDNSQNNFRILLDKGDLKNPKKPELETTTKTLLNYFFIGITLPNDTFWVNLRPDSENNIIDPDLATTDVGKILLEADLQLKKDTASFTSPETPKGKEYWEKLYSKAGELLGSENITIPTLTRPWIVPGEIIIRETKDNAYIYKATLKVMLEQDYLKDSAAYKFDDPRLKTINEYSSQLIRDLIIPKLTKEINTSPRYAPLRQVYYSLILAQWFKERFYGKGGLYSWLINKKNLQGLTSKTSWSKTTYFNAYQKSFKNGEYNIKEPVSTPSGQTIRSYFSGGLVFNIPILAAGDVERIEGPTKVTAISGYTAALPLTQNDLAALVSGGDLNDLTIKNVEMIEEAPSPSGLPAERPTQSGASSSIIQLSASVASAPVDEASILDKEVNRRDFLKWLGITAAATAVVLTATPTAAKTEKESYEEFKNRKNYEKFVTENLPDNLKELIIRKGKAWMEMRVNNWPWSKLTKDEEDAKKEYEKLLGEIINVVEKEYKLYKAHGEEMYIVPISGLSRAGFETDWGAVWVDRKHRIMLVDEDILKKGKEKVIKDALLDYSKKCGFWSEVKSISTVLGIGVGFTALLGGPVWFWEKKGREMYEKYRKEHFINSLLDGRIKIKKIDSFADDSLALIETSQGHKVTLGLRNIKVSKNNKRLFTIYEPNLILYKFIDLIAENILTKTEQELFFKLKLLLGPDNDGTALLSRALLKLFYENKISDTTPSSILTRIFFEDFGRDSSNIYALAMDKLSQFDDLDKDAKFLLFVIKNNTNALEDLYPDKKVLIEKLIKQKTKLKYRAGTIEGIINNLIFKENDFSERSLFQWILDRAAKLSGEERQIWLDAIGSLYAGMGNIQGTLYLDILGRLLKLTPGISGDEYENVKMIFGDLGWAQLFIRPIIDGTLNHIFKESGNSVDKFLEFVLQDEKIDQKLKDSILANYLVKDRNFSDKLLIIVKSDPGYYQEFIKYLNKDINGHFVSHLNAILNIFNPLLLQYTEEIKNIVPQFFTQTDIIQDLFEGRLDHVFEAEIDSHKFVMNYLRSEGIAPSSKQGSIKLYMRFNDWDENVLKAVRADRELSDFFIGKFISADLFNSIDRLDMVLKVFNPELNIDANILSNMLKSFGTRSSLALPTIAGVFNDALENSEGKDYKFLQNILNSADIVRITKISILKISPPRIVSKALKVNIKLARYLIDRADNFDILQKRLENPTFKEEINEISYNINREVTLYPKERRIGEDEKTSLFDILFRLEDIAKSKEIFDVFFRNAPEQYKIDIQALNELLEYVSIEDIKKIINGVVDNPKQSLDEITDNLKRQTRFMQNAEFIIRKASWILSNLFVLQDKIEQLEPISEALQNKGKNTEDLRGLLGKVDKAQKFNELISIASANDLNNIDVLRFKLESVSQEAKENILVEALQSVDILPDGQKEELFRELSDQFGYQPAESRNSIFLKALFNQSTDNERIRSVLGELKQERTFTGFKKSPLLQEFFSNFRSLATENIELQMYFEEIDRLGDKSQQKEAFKQLRSLYQDRQYSSVKLSKAEFTRLKEIISYLALQILLPTPKTQIPHAYYEALLRINPGKAALEAIRQLILAINTNKDTRGKTADLKNELNDKIIAFSTFNYNRKGEVLAMILKVVSNLYGTPTAENTEIFYNNLISYLEQYARIIDTYQKTQANLLPENINKELDRLVKEILEALLSSSKIEEAKIKQFSEKLAAIEADYLLARFKMQLKIESEPKVIQKLKLYAAHNNRFLWKDSQKRNIYQLIDFYLKTISDKEIYRNLLDALEAEIGGNFKEWKYQSKDYKDTIDEIIDIEVKKLPKTEQDKFNKAIKSIKEGTIYEKLQNIEGFESLKIKINKIKNWEKTLQKTLEGGSQAVFTDDFYALFNIGNSDRFSACQSCTYGNDLNRGLTGYLVNGTNKAVALLDGKGQVITRRIVRLRILEDGQGNKEPVIFVEESTQFGQTEIDELYRLLEVLSRRAGLAVVASQYRPAQTTKVLEGTKRQFAIMLYAGRSEFDYSDLYGSFLAEHITAGLYKQSRPVIKTGLFDLVIKDIPKSSIDESGIIETGFSTGLPAKFPSVSSPLKEKETVGLPLSIAVEELVGQKENGAFLAARKEVSSAGPPIIDKKGGIDFRALPIVNPPINAAMLKLSAADLNRLNKVNLNVEWAEIQNLVNAGIIPSNERVKEYVLASCLRQALGKEMNKVLGCIADIMRMEEDRVSDTDVELRNMLVLIEAGKPESELQLGLNQIKISPQEPQLMTQ